MHNIKFTNIYCGIEKNGGMHMLTVSTIGFLAFLQTAVFVVGYISNNNLFPEPLTQDEEKMYLENMAKGDEEARNILIERNLRLVAHVSNIDYGQNGWMYCAYLCDKVNTIEASTNMETEIWLARWNIAKPYAIEYFRVCGVGDYINYFTLSGRAPYNPNVVVMSDGIVRVYADVYNGTEWFIGYFQFDPTTKTFLNDSTNGNRRLYLTCNITYNGTAYETRKSGILNLYSALGISATGSVGQFICKHVQHPTNWKYYSVFTGTGKAILISTVNFKNYTLESVFNSTEYMYCDEAAIEFVDDNTIIMLMRTSGGTYSVTYSLDTKTWGDLEKVSKVEARPQIIKNKNGIFGIYNREIQSDEASALNRKTLVVSKLDSNNEWDEIILNTYPFPVHYPSYTKVEDMIFLSFTSGKKTVYSGTTNNGTSAIQVMPILLE